MRKAKLPYLHETKLTVRQGHQAWHMARALDENDEVEVVTELAGTFVDVGRVKTLGEGFVLAGALLTALRSTEAGERVPQMARERLTAKRRGAVPMMVVPG